ncbi:MAG: DUF3227 domain-containing protein [Candidatus Bathyarchaeota archaeon]|nr:DUF3227 domain-containing protein [Candidatus Bathyarchaeota archaeon]MDH5494931.1 DUF3227 domain-containing protein [Candidatus Bathyarchaeota archaeon]
MGIKKDKFHKTLLFALDESIKNIFGKNTAQAVYYHLEKRHLLKLEDILEKPQTFSEAIKEMFGETGAEVIETLLVKDLRTKFRVKGQRKETGKLVDCLDGLKITCIEK